MEVNMEEDEPYGYYDYDERNFQINNIDFFGIRKFGTEQPAITQFFWGRKRIYDIIR